MFFVTGESWLIKFYKKWLAISFCPWDFMTCPWPDDMAQTWPGNFQLIHDIWQFLETHFVHSKNKSHHYNIDAKFNSGLIIAIPTIWVTTVHIYVFCNRNLAIASYPTSFQRIKCDNIIWKILVLTIIKYQIMTTQ